MKHPKFKDLTGQKFGRWRVLNQTQNAGPKRNMHWACQCDCGTEREVSGPTLYNGKSRSCGCIVVENNKSRSLAPGQASRNNALYVYKWGASTRNLSWGLTETEFFLITEKTCHYCGASPSNRMAATKNGAFVYNGIDRINNKSGYTVENTVPCCKVCNKAKSSRTYEDFTQWLVRAGKHLSEV